MLDAKLLRRWIEKILLAKGARLQDTTRIPEVTINANLRGVDTHGVFTC